MNKLELFFKKNKVTKDNVKFAVTDSLCDEDGNALEWEFKKLSVKENELIKKECIHTKQTKRGKMETDFDADKYTLLVLVESCVFPNLNSADLQDSYGVKDANELIMAMVDSIGEWTRLQQFVMELNGLTETMQERVEEAKN